MKYKLVAMDLDGTLLSAEHEVDPRTIDAIQAAAEMGVQFTIATGRMHDSAVRFARQLEIEVPIITYNGSVIRSTSSGDKLRHLRVDRDLAEQALRVIDSSRALRYAFMDDRVLTDNHHEWSTTYANTLGIQMELVPDLADSVPSDPTMVVFMCEEEKTAEIGKELHATLGPGVHLTNSNPWFVDLLNKEASKAAALTFLADSLGVAMEETIAIGDSWNDLEMLEVAGLGVAVANATPRLRKRANYVTAAERGLGVLEMLEKFVLS